MIAAAQADVAVVVRRGPTDWSRLYRWDTGNDHVEAGSWLRGVVKHGRIDLSPDGRLLVCMVQQHGRDEDPRRDTYTVLCRPPWWTALALWFDGSAWGWGGWFPDSRSCVGTSGAPDVGSVPPWFDNDASWPDDATAIPPPSGGLELTVSHHRRRRDRWSLVEHGRPAPDRDQWQRPMSQRWERALRDGGAAVQLVSVDGAGRTSTEAALRRGDEVTPLGHDASVDVDRAGRALVTRQGRLEVHDAGTVRVVADLTGERPERVVPPQWAGLWPGPASV